ncbi:MAG TPA: NAD(P)/FAD-dependent oxidoreductase [Mycobacteriales bacterium]|nr:NAD(P)/FAD-dependent oxidoreductase [Mycobacteriales bacterium]
MPDAVVIGAGHNGLVAANLLADAGWSVVVLEEQDHPGGAVTSADYLGEGFTADVCSAFYPLTAASPLIRSLQLERFGLRWRHAPAVLGHALPDGRCVLLTRDLDETADGLDALHPGDGDAWRRLVGLWDRVGDDVVDALLRPFPPVRPATRLLRELGPQGMLHFARFGLLPVRRLCEEELPGPGGLLVAGCALHADLAPESTAGTLFGWLLTMLAQRVGFPVPEGGAQQLTDALVARLRAAGGTVTCSTPVREVLVRNGRAVGVRTDEGEVDAAKAVLADVVAPQLYGELVPWTELPEELHDDMRRFHWDYATVKVDWALDRPVPWTASDLSRAGTVHLGDLDEMTRYAADLATGRVPAVPFVLVGQMTTADPTRSPAGTEALWAYTHVPREVRGDPGARDVTITGAWDARELDEMADRLEQRIETFAPGFRATIRRRHVLGPPQLAAHDRNLVGGAINGGTTQLHQQLVFRPTPGFMTAATPIDSLFLASSSAHPGGGVHGACGANAAHAALRPLRRGPVRNLLRRRG